MNRELLIVVVTAAVCEYPEVKDDVIVSGKDFVYASEGIRLKCSSSQARLTRRNTHSKCLADSTWSIKNFTCSPLYLHNYVTRFAKTWDNGACWNFQYKAIIKLSAKNVFHKKLVVFLWGDNLVVVTPIYKNWVLSDSLSREELKYLCVIFVL